MTQKRAIATGLSVLLGAVAGAVVAVNERGVSSPRPDAAAAPPERRALSASTGAGVSTAGPAPTAPEIPPLAAPSSAPPAEPAPSAAAKVEPLVPAPAFELTPPSTKERLLAAEVSCTRKVPEDCERAARALDSGTLKARDPERARMLNRIALTVYVKQCEADRALACARLAEMNETGEIVQKNPANARSLRSRYHELCAKKPAQPGCSPAQPSSARNPG
jgi:hypothetical protein